MMCRPPIRLRHRIARLAAVAALSSSLAPAAWAAPQPSTHSTTTYHKVQIDGVGVFYREAGPKDAPTIILLHGFPTSSRQYEALIPLLATRYHIIAPDYPGFGQSDAPDPSLFPYTFDHLAKVMDDLLVRLKIDRYSLYIHDYGAPVGFRLMLAHPERLHALITQNGNAYHEGLGKKWPGIARFWADPKAHPEIVDTFLSFETTMQRHIAGSAHPQRYDPQAWLDEYAHLSKPGQRSSRRCCTTTEPTSRPIRSGRRGFATISRRPWSCGEPMTRPSLRPVARPSGRMSPMPKSTCSTQATSRSTRKPTTSPG